MLEQIDQQSQRLMWEVRQQTLQLMTKKFNVAEKTSARDLVTTVDKQNEKMIDERLKTIDPACRIVSEEGFGDQVDDLKGHVWIVDPIDGTMNFVMQKRNFAIMMGLYVDGQPTLGYIMDVVEGTLYHGGKGMGVFANQQRLHTPENKSLADSLMVMNGYLTMNNVHGLQKAARKARGLRMYGSAGIEMIYVLTGCLGAYVSHLHPWDLAAGRVLAEELGLVVKPIDDDHLNVLSSNLVLVATKQAGQDLLTIAE